MLEVLHLTLQLRINMNYKESVNLILNRMGLPTILALFTDLSDLMW